MKLFGWQITRAKQPATRFLGDIVKVDLSPGDVCVLLARGPLTKEAAERISLTWRGAVGDDVTLLILQDDMKLGVLSPPQAVVVHERLSDVQAVAEAVAA